MLADMAVRRFGVFELDEMAGELRRHGRRVPLAAQPFKTLALLTSRPGDVVARDELRRHLWSDDTFVEFDRGLNFCIAEARHALGDDARRPRFIETVPRRGYRFIADVHDGPEQRHGRGEQSGAPGRVGWTLAAVVALLIAQQPFRVIAHNRATADSRALAAFERAMQATNDPLSKRNAITALRAATRFDPRFAEAHYALADIYLDLVMARELPADAALFEARAAAERAVALEEAPESRQLLGTLRLLAEWDWAGARSDLARAVALQPKWDLGFVAYARVLSAAGDDAGAIAAIDRAETLTPNCDLILFDAGQIYARAGRFHEAEEKFDRAIQFGPPRHLAQAQWIKQVRGRQLTLAAARRDWPAAHRAATAIVAASGVAADSVQRFATQEPATAVMRFLSRSVAAAAERPAGGRVDPVHLAMLEALRGNSQQALDWLERAAAERDSGLVYALRNPEFTSIRPLPRFQMIASRLKRS